MLSTLICQNQTSLQGKVAPWRTSAGPCVARQVREGQVTAKWEDFGKLLVKKAHPLQGGRNKTSRPRLF